MQALSLPHTSSRSIGQSKCHGQVQCLYVCVQGMGTEWYDYWGKWLPGATQEQSYFFTLFHSMCDLSSQPGIKDILPAMETWIPNHQTASKVPRAILLGQGYIQFQS